MGEKRAIGLNCMDGRVQIPVIEWAKANLQVDHVDIITEPGMDGFLFDRENSIEDIKRKINISIKKNNAEIIIVVGHHDCKGNPVDELLHKEHIRLAVERMMKEYPHSRIVGLWINSDWAGEAITNNV